MPMKNPVHPGALAEANLDELNLSVAEAAKVMKITRQQLYNVMRGASGDTVEWIMHGMPPANQLPPGLRVGLQRAAQLLAQANPSLAAIHLIRVSVMAADETGDGEHVIRWIPVVLEAPSTATLPAAP